MEALSCPCTEAGNSASERVPNRGTVMSQTDLLSVVETIYDLSLPSQRFNSVFHEAVEDLLPGTHATTVYSPYLGAQGEVLLRGLSCLDPVVQAYLKKAWQYEERGDGVVEVTLPFQRWLFKANWEHAYHGGLLGSDSMRGLVLRAACVGIPRANDIFFLSSSPVLSAEPGVAIAGSRESTEALPPKTLQRWQKVRAHLGAAVRLRNAFEARQLELSEPTTDGAVVQPDGKLLHAHGAAQESNAQEAIRQAAIEVDRARLHRNGRGDDALEMWKAMVRGEWSLVERFDHDGRRYYVAHRNGEQDSDPRGLTKQEARVSTCVARGLGNGLTAYTLGISEVTVATHLRSALRKLQCQSRAQLVRELGPGYPSARRKSALAHLVFRAPPRAPEE